MRVASTLHQVALVILPSALAAVSVSVALGVSDPGQHLVLALAALCLVTLGLVRWGYPGAAAWLLIGGCWGVLSGRVLQIGFVGPPVLGAYMAVILAAGVVMGPRSAAGITLASAAMSVLALWLPNSPPPGAAAEFGDLGQAVGSVFVLIAGAALAIVATLQIRAALDRARRNEANLAESRERYRSLMENLPDVITEIGEDGRNCYVGPNSREVLGYEPLELMGRDPFQLIHEKDRPMVLEALAQLRESGQREPPVFRFRNADGSWHWLEANAAVRKTSEGTEHILVASRDVSARVEAEQEVREQRERYRRLVESLPIAIFELNSEGRLLAMNGPGLLILGVTSEQDLLGNRVSELFVAESEGAAAEAVLLAASGRAADFEAELQRGGARRHLLVSLVPIHREGRLSKVIGYAQDDTSRLHLDAQLRQAQKLESLGVLAGGIAHDFNNLLVGIQGNAEVALERLPESSPARTAVADIHEAGRLAATLTGQLLSYAGRGVSEVQTLDLSALVAEMAQLLRMAVPAGIQLEIEESTAPAWVRGSAAQIRQLVMNLITNAVEAYAGIAGVVQVRQRQRRVGRDELERAVIADPEQAGEYRVLEVSDRGSGMSEETRHRIFDPFFSTKTLGHGLGLAAVLGIVRDHGGALALSSRLGEGTCFRVMFPAVNAPAAARAGQPEPRRTPPARLRVLLVDDEGLVRRVARRLLETRGWQVGEAASGEEAIALLREDPAGPSCVLLDRSMPGLDGEETCERLRELRPELPVLFASGDLAGWPRQSFPASAPTGLIQKPYSGASLDRALRELVGC